MMDAERILDLADKAARSVRRRYSLAWSAMDWEDARQEAATGIVRALRSRPDLDRAADEGYFFSAARQAATRYAFRTTSAPTQRLGHWAEADRAELHAIEPVERGWGAPLTDEDIPAIRARLVRTLRSVGARGGPKTRDQVAVARDLVILQMLSEGASNEIIGERLGMSAQRIREYRQQLRQRLGAIAAEQEAMTCRRWICWGWHRI